MDLLAFVVAAYGSIQKNEFVNNIKQLSVSSIFDLNRMSFSGKLKIKLIGLILIKSRILIYFVNLIMIVH